MLRYHQEIRKESDFGFPSEDMKKFRVSSKEIEMPEKFIELIINEQIRERR